MILLPIKIVVSTPNTHELEHVLEMLRLEGVVFCFTVNDDHHNTFRVVQLPAGWKKAVRDDSFSHIEDSNGRVRIRVFSGEAFSFANSYAEILTEGFF